ncbi:DNA-directed primase/polymerase protein-like [Liolophura sinensis]|uniref:DNA-directed primase/polymerase protein-like n=1 Tax=Liolophura sinensis TaxID=3198878 RepID=UPI0031589A17
MENWTISRASFYGESLKRKNLRLVEEKVEKRVKEFKKYPLPEKYQNRITGPSTGWESFFRQQEAFSYARSRFKDLHVFAFESDFFDKGQGQRMYVAVSYPVFWHTYSQLAPNQRHHYEVIPEGSVCKLYFDLEFTWKFNPDRDGSSMTSLLIQYVCCWMKHIYKRDCPKEQVIELDASTDSKFSRHLIFQLPAAAFKDNRHAGNFVSYIFGKLSKYLRHDYFGLECDDDTEEEQKPETQNFGIEIDDKNSDEERKTVCLLDKRITVQNGTKNMTPEKAKEHPKDIAPPTSEDKFSQIIDSFGLTDLHTLFVKNKHGETILFCDTGVYTKNRNFRLFLSSKLKKNNPLVVSPDNTYGKSEQLTQEQLFMDCLISNVQYSSKLKILTFETQNGSQNRQLFYSQNTDRSVASQKGFLEGYQKSPYPEIDDFISGQLSQDGVRGAIRHWTYFSQGELLVYDIAHYRWCDNVQRHHKSNNIMFIADLLQGVYYQKCHDPECRSQNYKSADRPLPDYVLPAYYFRDDEDHSIFQESGDGTPKVGDGMEEVRQGGKVNNTVDEQIDASANLADASVKQHQREINDGEVSIENVGTVNRGEEHMAKRNEAMLENSEAMVEHKRIIQDHKQGVLKHKEAILDHSDAVLKANDAVLKQRTKHHTVGRDYGDERKDDVTLAKQKDSHDQMTDACGLWNDGLSDDEELVTSVLLAEEQMGDTNLWKGENSDMTDSELMAAVQMVIQS